MSNPRFNDLVWGSFAADRPFFGVYGKLGEAKGSFALLAAMDRLKRSGIDIGLVALAHGGTLFLDEIGDLPLAIQPKLLRMLERGEVTPLGGRKSESFEVRFVAATHRDLPAEVARGAFRAS